ncbi:hypothetical protein BB560_002030 [Smittium megazygosporum]|uniref:SH3 domain-containing protein n=1 Tax=Smittium megazygosporum TaxID=133381 RepID=A0A2T9ZFX1_9FUNG|nr:hypothetical protein BB560_002030 [Smittium megazygosporum]
MSQLEMDGFNSTLFQNANTLNHVSSKNKNEDLASYNTSISSNLKPDHQNIQESKTVPPPLNANKAVSNVISNLVYLENSKLIDPSKLSQIISMLPRKSFGNKQIDTKQKEQTFTGQSTNRFSFDSNSMPYDNNSTPNISTRTQLIYEKNPRLNHVYYCVKPQNKMKNKLTPEKYRPASLNTVYSSSATDLPLNQNTESNSNLSASHHSFLNHTYTTNLTTNIGNSDENILGSAIPLPCVDTSANPKIDPQYLNFTREFFFRDSDQAKFSDISNQSHTFQPLAGNLDNVHHQYDDANLFNLQNINSSNNFLESSFLIKSPPMTDLDVSYTTDPKLDGAFLDPLQKPFVKPIMLKNSPFELSQDNFDENDPNKVYYYLNQDPDPLGYNEFEFGGSLEELNFSDSTINLNGDRQENSYASNTRAILSPSRDTNLNGVEGAKLSLEKSTSSLGYESQYDTLLNSSYNIYSAGPKYIKHDSHENKEPTAFNTQLNLSKDGTKNNASYKRQFRKPLPQLPSVTRKLNYSTRSSLLTAPQTNPIVSTKLVNDSNIVDKNKSDPSDPSDPAFPFYACFKRDYHEKSKDKPLFKKGDLVLITERVGTSWYTGSLVDSSTFQPVFSVCGIFHENFIIPIDPIHR